MNNRTFSLPALAFLLLASKIFSQPTITFPVNAWQAIQNNQATVTHSPTDIGSTVDIFDGNFSTLARSANVNPFVVTLVFDYTINVSSMTTMQNNGFGWWTVEAANSLADLNSHAGSYQLLFSQSPLAQDVIATVPVSPSKKAFRLTMQKTIGDGYVHLWDWGITATATVQITDLCLLPSQAKLLKNNSFDWQAKGRDAAGNTYDLPSGVSWSSSNAGMVSVNSSGLLTSFGSVGEANVTVSWNGLTKTKPVKVVDDFAMPLAPQRTVKVALVIIDPHIPAAGGQRFSEVVWDNYFNLNWQQLNGGSPQQLANKVRDSLTALSGGVATYQFVETHDEPTLLTTFGSVELSVDSMYHLFQEPGWATLHLVAEQQSASQFHYNELLNKYNFCTKSNNHQIDEVWVYAMPFIGMWEASMTGTGAFWINGPVQTGNSCTDLLPIMGFNYERTYDLALHNFGHRMETTLYHLFNTTVRYVPTDPPYPPGTMNELRQFMNFDALEPGKAHVGNVHFPPNAIENYGYSHPGTVTSYEQNWRRYPFIFNQTRQLNCSDWNCDHDGFMRWWLRRLPKYKCLDRNGYLNNWWLYLTDFNEGKAAETQAGCDCEMFADSPPQPGNYCQSKSNFPWEDWIAKVKVGTIDKASGKSPYSDFTSLSTNVSNGASIELTTGFSYFTFDEYWKVWIDFNHDGIFSEPGEVAFSGVKTKPANGTATATLAGTLSIPGSATAGATRMRVSMKRNAYATPCETLPFGEVEDYGVNISGAPAQLPNLFVNTYEVIPGTGGGTCFTLPGQKFLVLNGLALNNGTAAAGAFVIKGWLSKDQQPDAGDLLWKSFSYSGLVPNNVVSWSFTEPVPTSLPPGRYFLLLKADADNAVAESDETDNLTAISVWIGAPDFSVSQVNGVPATAVVGSSLNVAVQAKNLSAFALPEMTGSLSAHVFLSGDNQFESGSDLLLNSVGIPFTSFTLPPQYLNGTAWVNVTAVLPSNLPPGNYFLFVRLTGASCERTENNNLSAAIPIQITGGMPGTYCPSSGNFPWHEWIARVKIGNLDNSSAKSEYGNFTALSANLQAGNSYPITLTTGFSYFTFDEYWRVWIDFNHDGVFSTPNEVVNQQILTAPANGTATASVTGSVNVPSSASLGATRMRVSMKRGAFPTACETLPFGEVEDYSVNISSSLNEPGTGDRADNLQLEAVASAGNVQLFCAWNLPENLAAATVEKSADGIDFQPLAQLKAEPAAAVQALDETPFDGFNFYRLRLEMAGGELRFSPVRIVSLDALDDVAIFPNPAQGEIFVHFEGKIPAGAAVRIFDLHGQLILEKRLAEGEAAPVRMGLENLGEGTYFAFVMRDGRKAVGKRFIVVR